MTTAEFFVLTFILIFFGGISGTFTFISIHLIQQKLQEHGFYFRFDTTQE